MKKRAKKTRRPAAPSRKSRAAKKRGAVQQKLKSKARASRPKATKAAAKSDAKRLAQRWFDELWQKRNPGVLFEMMHPSAVGDTEGGMVAGPDEFTKKLHSPLLGAFPDMKLTVEGVIGEGDDAAVRWRIRATHTGDTLGIPASNRRVSLSGITWLQFKDGQVIGGWDRWNAAGLMAYLREGTTCATVRLPDTDAAAAS